MKNKHYHWNTENCHPVRICYTTTPAPMKAHSQNELELMYFYNTTDCHYKCRGNDLVFSSGQLAVINPLEIHSCNNWGKDCSIVCLIINTNQLALPNFDELYFKNQIEDRKIQKLFVELKELLCGDYKTPILDCLIMKTVYELLALLLPFSTKADKTDVRGRKKELALICEYISENITSKIYIDELSRQMHISEDRFFHIFKEEFGISPTEYIMAKRISKSCDLLGHSDMKITDIAQECNFCTASYFSKIFRRYMGCSPKEYRREFENAIS